MAYRAHITVHEYETGERQGRTKVEKFANAMKATGWPVYVGTRQGVPGIWIERKYKTEFESAIRIISGKAADFGIKIAVWTTNQPSQQAVAGIPYVRFVGSSTTRYPAVMSVRRG